MRLLFVHERFGAMAGAEVNAHLTASALKQRGHRLGIIHGPSTGKAEPEWQEVFPSRFLISNSSRAEIVTNALAEFQPDLVYVHKISDLAVLNSLVDSGTPLVRMVHDHDLYCMRSYKYHPLTRQICSRPASAYCIFPCGAIVTRNRQGVWPLGWVSYSSKKKEIKLNQRFHRMVVATGFMKQELLRNGFDESRIEIHAPVPLTTVSQLPGSFSPRNLIVYAGQVIRGKGVDILLQALALVRVPFECVILGEGNQRPYCEALCHRLGLQAQVSFKGYVAPAQLQQYYCDASVAVVSSVWPEPFGAVGLEAMRYGLPVVAFDAGGVKEWLSDGLNGFLVPRMDHVRFAARLEQLLKDKSLARQFGARGRDMVTEKFSFGRYIDGLEGMFTRVIAESKPSAHQR